MPSFGISALITFPSLFSCFSWFGSKVMNFFISLQYSKLVGVEIINYWSVVQNPEDNLQCHTSTTLDDKEFV